MTAGVLTIAAPCTLALLPVILGTSIGGKNLRVSITVILSLIASIILFSLLLRSAITFIIIDPKLIAAISGSLIAFVGLTMLFHNQWARITVKLGLSNSSANLLQKSSSTGDESLWRAILVGAALGPVFTSCSPTFAIVLAVILPQSAVKGFYLIILYALGLGLTLFLVALLGYKGRKLIAPLANPEGKIRKIIAVSLIFVGVAIIFGVDKSIETSLIESGFLGSTNFEVFLLEKFGVSF